MRIETWSLINQGFQKFRSSWAECIGASEFDEAFVGFPFTPEYRDFVLRYGGGFVGTYPIYGLRLAESMGMIEQKSTAPEITKFFREQKWPGAENWLIFSIDQSGNPIGFDASGAVWISDSLGPAIVKLGDSFEDFLRKWALRIHGEWPGSSKE
jgi:hypothetical protein